MKKEGATSQKFVLYVLASIFVGTLILFLQAPVNARAQVETPTNTASPTVTETASETPSPSETLQETSTATPTPTVESSFTPTGTETLSATPTPTPSVDSRVPNASIIYEIPGLPWKPGEAWTYNQGPYGGISHFGAPQYALDFGTPGRKPGKVYAADSGTLIETGYTCVKIQSESGLNIWYQHIDPKDIAVLQKRIEKGGKALYVEQGSYIGTTSLVRGCDGYATGHHVHIYWEVGGQHVNATINGWSVVGIKLKRNLFGVSESVSPDLVSTVLHCATPGTTPGLRPVKDFVVSDKTPRFYWERNACGVSYEVQISTDINFPNNNKTFPLVQLDPGTREYTPSLKDGVYYWRVRAIGMNGETGKWTETFKLTVDTTPPAIPTLLSPAFHYVSLGAPIHTWSAVAGATAYQFEYGTLSSGGLFPIFKPVYSAPGQLTKPTHKPTYTISGLVYWRVRAVDSVGNWSEWSDPRPLGLLQPLPTKPTLKSPKSGASTTDTTPTLAWNAASNAFRYEIWISTSTASSASNLVPESKRMRPGTDLSFTSTTLNKGKYYWRVRAYNSDGTPGPWSSFFSLGIK